VEPYKSFTTEYPHLPIHASARIRSIITNTQIASYPELKKVTT
jgi:hypothetical protein